MHAFHVYKTQGKKSVFISLLIEAINRNNWLKKKKKILTFLLGGK